MRFASSLHHPQFVYTSLMRRLIYDQFLTALGGLFVVSFFGLGLCCLESDYRSLLALRKC